MTGLLSTAQEYLHFGRATPAVLVLVLCWSWETFYPRVIGRKGRLRHAARNLSMAAINGLFLFFTLGLATTLLSLWVTEEKFGLLFLLDIGWGGRLIFGFLLIDAWAYFWHRINHNIDFLWRFHRIHHNDHEMDCTTSARFHFGELGIAALLRLPVILIFGIEPLPILMHETILVAVSQFHHSNIRLGWWDRLLRWVIVTPALHHIHHSRERPETNSNYASILSVWDRLCRSFRNPERSPNIELGLSEYLDPRWHTVKGMLTTPLSEIPPSANPSRSG